MSTSPPTTLASTAPPTTVPTTLPTTAAPTTIVTTLAPTTLLTTLAPTTTLTTLAPTTDPDTDINCDPLESVSSLTFLRTDFPAAPRDETKDMGYFADAIESVSELTGEWLNQCLAVDILESVSALTGTLNIGVVFPSEALESVSLLTGIIEIEAGRNCAFVSWAKPGTMDFTIDRSNRAGKTIMDWRGCIYQILQLGKNKAVVYGENGITVMEPSGVHWGRETIYRIGLAGRNAVVGTRAVHFFIDSAHKLFMLDEQGLTLLDYSEFLSELSSPVMSMNLETGIVYICDSTKGFVYSSRSQSFGKGPAAITGLGVQGGNLYVASPNELERPKFYIKTQTYDFGTRRMKTIREIELGTDVLYMLHAMIETRVSNNEGFIKSAWVRVNPSGRAVIPCYGLEFKFHLKSFIYEYVKLDYMRVHGTIHEFSAMENIE